MSVGRAAEAGVALIGLYALVMALLNVPSRITAALLLPKVYEGAATLTDLVQVDPALLSIGRGGALLMGIATLLPGLVVILARRRIAGMLLPTSDAPDTNVGAAELLRIGLVLLGINIVLVSITAAAGAVSTPLLMPKLSEARWGYRLLSPVVSCAGGVILLLLSRRVAQRMTRSPSSGDGA